MTNIKSSESARTSLIIHVDPGVINGKRRDPTEYTFGTPIRLVLEIDSTKKLRMQFAIQRPQLFERQI